MCERLQHVAGIQGCFPDEVLGLPPKRDIDFTIELVPGKSPVSKTPYRVSTPERLELKMQLQELWEKKYIRPSVSPWGALVWFDKEKDDILWLCIDHIIAEQIHCEEQVSFA